MRTLNLDPLWRSSVGFDRLFNLIDQSRRLEPEDNYPPFDIVRTGENDYRITVAVAGFAPEQIAVIADQESLVVSGRMEKSEGRGEYLHRGISARPFDRRFDLAEHVEVKCASVKNGLLEIDLARELPEALKPRRIPVTTAASQQDNKRTIDKAA